MQLQLQQTETLQLSELWLSAPSFFHQRTNNDAEPGNTTQLPLQN